MSNESKILDPEPAQNAQCSLADAPDQASTSQAGYTPSHLTTHTSAPRNLSAAPRTASTWVCTAHAPKGAKKRTRGIIFESIGLPANTGLTEHAAGPRSFK